MLTHRRKDEFSGYGNFRGGVVQFSTPIVSNRIVVANMFAQDGICSQSTGNRASVNDKPIKYQWLLECMSEVKGFCNRDKMEIYAPKFGSGLSKGNWDFIEELIEEIWCDIPVTVWSL